MKTQLILVVCVILALCGCEKKKTIHNTAFSGKDYTMKFPDTWEIDDTGIMSTDIIGLSPLEDPQDAFRENVTVVLENISTSMTDSEYLDLTLAQMSRAFGLSPGTTFTPATVGHHKGYHLYYSFQMGQNELDNDVYIVIQEGSVYIITCSHAKGKRAAFKPTMDSVIRTFKIE